MREGEINGSKIFGMAYRNSICTRKDNVTGEVRTFKSENLWDNPEYIIKERNITTFPVYIDINNRKKYYLSLEEFEKE